MDSVAPPSYVKKMLILRYEVEWKTMNKKYLQNARAASYWVTYYTRAVPIVELFIHSIYYNKPVYELRKKFTRQWMKGDTMAVSALMKVHIL